MQISRLTKTNHYEAITEKIKQLIMDGNLKAGDRLPSTKAMSEQFGVGRSTTREALSALKAMGLIEIRQGGGCRVISNVPQGDLELDLPELHSLRMNRQTLLELMEARQALEVSNAAAAAEKRTEADLAALQLIVTEMKDAIGNDLEGERTDVQFHLTLAHAAHNSIMAHLFESIVGQLETAIREIRRVELYASRTVAEQLYEDHLRIFEAVKAGDAGRSSAAMKQHLQHVERNLMKYI